MMNATLGGKPDAGNPYVRFDEGEVAPAKTRRGSLFYKSVGRGALVSAALALTLALWTSWASAVEFPLAEGGDIASDGADGWNGAKAQAASEATFKGKGAVYVASADVTLGTVLVNANSTFDLDEARKVTAAKLYMPGRNLVTLLDGGLWDLSNSDFYVSGSQGAQSGGSTMVLTNRCSVSNVKAVRVAYKDANNTLRIVDGAKLSAASLLLGVNASGNNRLEVLSGGSLTLSGSLHDGSITSSGSDAVTGNAILVSGEDSTLTCQSVNVGRYYSGNAFTVRNGARASLTENLLVGSSGYRSSGNSVRFENATVSCWQIMMANYPGSTNNSVYIGGSANVFTAKVNNVARYPFFEHGGYNRFTLADHAFWGYPLSMAMDTAASNNTLSVVGGAHLKIAGVLFSGTNHVLSCANTLFVGDGATAEAAGFLFGRFGNRIVVSNATLKATQTTASNSGVRLGEPLRNVDQATIRDNELILQGDAPFVDSVQKVKILNGSELHFDVPENGYAANVVPIQAGGLEIDASSRLRASGVAAFQKQPHARETVLAQTSTAMSIGADVLAAANAALTADGCRNARFVLSTDKKSLSLRVPSASGLILIFK